MRVFRTALVLSLLVTGYDSGASTRRPALSPACAAALATRGSPGRWPDSTLATRILAAQFPGGLTAGQQRFVASHMAVVADLNAPPAAGVFVGGFADPALAPADWQRSMNRILALVGRHEVVIAQDVLSSADDVATRLYYLASYLLVRGDRTYLDYFAGGPLEWYPEWDLDLGAPAAPAAATVADLASDGAYVRELANGWAAVNPSREAVTLRFPSGSRLVVPQGGGTIGTDGTVPGTIMFAPASSVTLPPATAAIVLK